MPDPHPVMGPTELETHLDELTRAFALKDLDSMTEAVGRLLQQRARLVNAVRQTWRTGYPERRRV